MQNWRGREDLRSAEDFPRPRADGRHDVDAWRKFMLGHGLNRADEAADRDEVPEARWSILDWKEYREQLQCREIERRIARSDHLLLVATDLEVPLGATFLAIQTKLSQFPARVARFMVGLRDEADAEARLRDEMEAVLRDLNLADYLEQDFDEAERAVLRRIGQRSLAVTSAPESKGPSSSEPSTEAPEEKTAQDDPSLGAKTAATDKRKPKPRRQAKVTRPRAKRIRKSSNNTS